MYAVGSNYLIYLTEKTTKKIQYQIQFEIWKCKKEQREEDSDEYFWLV